MAHPRIPQHSKYPLPPPPGFATSKSWGKQLKAFDRSVRVAPTILFSSRHLRMFLSFSREHVDNYIASYKPNGIQKVCF